MAGLSSLTSTSSSETSQLPSWYQSAQQDVTGRAQQAANATPQLQQTTGQQAVNLLQGQNNPFAQAQGVLGDIASGATNPWRVDASGQVSPDTSSPLGGLYAAQQQYLSGLLPDIDAQSTAGAIGSGQFGSLRGLTAANKARADAFNKLATEQLGNALTAQTQGIQAGSALANTGTSNIDAALKTAQYQQASPFAGASNLGKVIAGLGDVGKTINKTAKESPLKTAGILGELATNSPLARAALNRLGIAGGNSTEILGSLFNKVFTPGGGRDQGSGQALPGGGVRYAQTGGGYVDMRPDGIQVIVDPQGNQRIYDPSGDLINTTSAQDAQNQMVDADTGDYAYDPGTGDYAYDPGTGGDDTGNYVFDNDYSGYDDSGYYDYNP